MTHRDSEVPAITVADDEHVLFTDDDEGSDVDNAPHFKIPHYQPQGITEDSSGSDDEGSNENEDEGPNEVSQGTSQGSPSESPNGDLPAFKKRPLSDTPFVSKHSSPVLTPSSDESLAESPAPVLLSSGTKDDSTTEANNTDGKDGSRLRVETADNGEAKSPKSPKSMSFSLEKRPSLNDILSEHNSVPLNNNEKRENGEDAITDDEDSRQTRSNNNNERMPSAPAGINSNDILHNSLKAKPSSHHPKRRATTLDVPGLTKSRSSPDGTIASADVGSKLVIVMVGLPARGKSYITNKLARYLNWSQHECRVFNVGNTRRKTDANNLGPSSAPLPDVPSNAGSNSNSNAGSAGASSTNIQEQLHKQNEKNMKEHAQKEQQTQEDNVPAGTTHEASFFSPENKSSARLREKWAIDTLDELLENVLHGPVSVGIFDATNTTRMRRHHIISRIKERSQSQLKILFLESVCDDARLIEQNIRLKLSGPDYRTMDPDHAIKDFTGRLHNYEKVYQTLGEYEEQRYRDIQYVKMINVGKKIITYNVQGFLASQAVYFLLNFNLKERMIIITRHGESVDNVHGKIGGDCDLTQRGVKFSKALTKFITFKKQEFRERQLENFKNKLRIEYEKSGNAKKEEEKKKKTFYDVENETSTDITDSSQGKINSGVPNNTETEADIDTAPEEPTFCVWTSMLKRSIQTAQFFNDNDYFVKEMRMLDELGVGKMEGMTYREIQDQYPKEFMARINNKLSYRYPGLGGESYLDVINRLKPIITEIERSEDHLLLIAHRVVCRILLGYFLNISKEHIGDLDIPLHSIYILEPKTYGVDWSLYEYNERLDWFYKMDKFKYTKKLKEVNLSNLGKRKYSVVPSLPRGEFAEKQKDFLKEQATEIKHATHEGLNRAVEARGGISGNLNRLRNVPHEVGHRSHHDVGGNACGDTASFTRGGASKSNNKSRSVAVGGLVPKKNSSEPDQSSDRGDSLSEKERPGKPRSASSSSGKAFEMGQLAERLSHLQKARDGEKE